LSNGKRGTVFFAAHHANLYRTMAYQKIEQYIPSKENVIDNFLRTEYDLLEIERLYTDMVLHYILPTNDWNLGSRRTTEVLENSVIIQDLIRGLIRAEGLKIDNQK
jgi:hypothetical protein